MNYEEALEYIHKISWTFCKPGLERITELCEKLGNPQSKLKFIHVAGTNGKGSFCSMTDSVLRSAGYRVGLYTSPYIKEFNERMRVDGKNIGNEVLAELTSEVRPIADAMKDTPTEFELITAIAFLYFAREKCDVVILEAGMGGRLDSTNIIRNPLISVITGIALDHTAFLGDTVEKIAFEKAGIIKDNSPVLYGGEDVSAGEVIRKTAKERGSDIYFSDYSALTVSSATLEGTKFSYKGYADIKIPLLGLYQPKNASLVIDAVEILKKTGLDIPENAIRVGLSRAKWCARFEIIRQEKPLMIFDGAHNPQGIASAVKSILKYFEGEKVYVLSGVLRDKDYDFIAEKLSSAASHAFTMTPDNPRALTAKEYAKVMCSKGVDAKPYESIESALAAAMDAAAAANKPLVCLGSLYTYVDIIKFLEKQ